MEKLAIVVLIIVALVAVVGLAMQYKMTATGKVTYQNYQSPSQKCVLSCGDRYVFGTTVYQACVQDCLPGSP